MYILNYNYVHINKDLITGIIIIVGSFAVGELILIMIVMGVKSFSKVLIKEDDEKFFIQHNLSQIYCGLARRYSETNAENISFVQTRGKTLQSASIGLVSLLILIFIIVIFILLNI